LICITTQSTDIIGKAGNPGAQKLSDRSTFVVPCADGSAISARLKGLCRVPEPGQSASLAVKVETDTPDIIINDGKTGPDGRLYFGTRDTAQWREMDALYRLDEDLIARRVTGRVTPRNGNDWSPDASVLYFVDSGDYLVWAFDFDSRGGPVSWKRIFARVAEPDGLPDGLTVDAAGGVWVAMFGGRCVYRYSPEGQLTEVIPTPVRYPTSCAFAGPQAGHPRGDFGVCPHRGRRRNPVGTRRCGTGGQARRCRQTRRIVPDATVNHRRGRQRAATGRLVNLYPSLS
jgi:sugar lactone lactonase YvrE